MNIKQLQKLDFLLKIINQHHSSTKYQIKFGMNGRLYTGSFLPSKVEGNIQYKDFHLKVKDLNNIQSNNFENASNMWDDFCLKTRDISVSNNDIFKKIFFIQDDEEESAYIKLINTSKYFDSFYYFIALNQVIQKYNFEFSEELPSMIYSVVDSSSKQELNFMHVNEEAEFDFVSLTLN